jgi:hypothetical protein
VNTQPTARWGAENWPQITRLREPHEYWQRRVVPERPDPDSEVEPLGADDAVYHIGSVTPYVLRLIPGATDSLLEFVAALGIVGLVKWVGGPAPAGIKPGFEIWEPLCTAVLLKEPTLCVPELQAAWIHPHTVERFTEEHARLSNAWETSTEAREAASDTHDEARQMLRRQLIGAFFQQPYPYELEFAVTSLTDRIVERPRHILARSAFELMDALTDRLPKRCERCTTPFPPIRSDQRYCTDNCRKRAFRKEYDKTPYRKVYQRMYRRYKRNTITEAEFVAWKDSAKEAKS